MDNKGQLLASDKSNSSFYINETQPPGSCVDSDGMDFYNKGYSRYVQPIPFEQTFRLAKDTCTLENNGDYEGVFSCKGAKCYIEEKTCQSIPGGNPVPGIFREQTPNGCNNGAKTRTP